MKESEQKGMKSRGSGPGIGFLIFGIVFIVMVCLGYTFVPYGRFFAGERPLEPWQMWAAGLLLIAMSIGGVIRQMHAAKRALILTTTMKSKDGDSDAEQSLWRTR